MVGPSHSDSFLSRKRHEFPPFLSEKESWFHLYVEKITTAVMLLYESNFIAANFKISLHPFIFDVGLDWGGCSKLECFK